MLNRIARPAAVFASLCIVFLIGNCTSSGNNSNTAASSNVAPTYSNSDAPETMTGTEEVGYLLDRYNEALLKKDAKSLDEIWADDLSFVNPRGELLNKKQRMENINTGATELQKADVSEKNVRIYGDTAVATLVVKINGQYSGKEADEAFRVTTVWAKPKGMWQMAATQMTPIVK